MTTASEFRVHDQVAGPIEQRGVVAKVANGAVTVAYHERGGGRQTTYTADWLAKWPAMLKHIGARS
jgi:hypothetical protein